MNLNEHKNFLKSERNYSLAKSFWDDTFARIIHYDFEPWVGEKYANGKDIMTGNPIYSALLRGNKAIRVIQIEDTNNDTLLISWFDKRNFNNKTIKELVITIQPNQFAYNDAKNLIKDFVNGVLKASDIKIINLKYEKIFKQNAAIREARKLNENYLFKVELKPTEKKLRERDISLLVFKKVYNLIDDELLENIQNINRPMKRFCSSYYSFKKVLSLNGNYDFQSHLSKKEYSEGILNEYSSIHNFMQKFKTEKEKLQESINNVTKLESKLHNP